MQEDERRDTHIRGAMDKSLLPGACIHRAYEPVEVRRLQRGEIVRLRHAARGELVINAQGIAEMD